MRACAFVTTPHVHVAYSIAIARTLETQESHVLTRAKMHYTYKHLQLRVRCVHMQCARAHIHFHARMHMLALTSTSKY